MEHSNKSFILEFYIKIGNYNDLKRNKLFDIQYLNALVFIDCIELSFSKEIRSI